MPSDSGPEAASVPLDLKDLFRRTWQLFARAPAFHLLAGAAIVILGALTLGVLFGPLVVAYLRRIERLRHGEPVAAKALFAFDGLAWRAVVCATVVTLAFLGGLVLFVLPGLLVVWAWGYSFWFVALDDKPPFTALRASRHLSKSHFTSVATVWITVLLLMAAGVAAIAGVILTLPLACIFATLARTEMMSRSGPGTAPGPRETVAS